MKIFIIVASVILVAAGVAYFVFYQDGKTISDLGGETPEKMFSALADIVRKEDVASAEKYFISQDVEGRKVWANILAVNKEKGFLGKLADSLAAPKFIKSISETEQQFLIYNKPQPQGVLINLAKSAEFSFWQIKSLAIVNAPKK